MTATIHTTELRSWQDRANRNEILIQGMTFPLHGKVELDYIDTPHLRSGARLGSADGSQPSRIAGNRAVEAECRNASAGSTPATPTTFAHDPTSRVQATAPAADSSPAAVRELYYCPACGKPFDFDAGGCPHCGKQERERLAILDRIKALAGKRRHQYHQWKKGEAPNGL